tara:strand:+ start:785 stop:1381 length:597 start_codon:yes stop_codon:yes gene_type:complete
MTEYFTNFLIYLNEYIGYRRSGVVINWTQPQGGSVPSTLAPLMGLYSRIDPEEDTASGVEPDSEAAYLNDAPAFTLNDAFFLFRLSDGKWIVGGGHNYSAARKIADARPERVEEAAADILHILNGEGPGAQRVRIMTEGANFSPVDATIQYEFIDTMEDFSHPLDSSGHTSEVFIYFISFHFISLDSMTESFTIFHHN